MSKDPEKAQVDMGRTNPFNIKPENVDKLPLEIRHLSGTIRLIYAPIYAETYGRDKAMERVSRKVEEMKKRGWIRIKELAYIQPWWAPEYIVVPMLELNHAGTERKACPGNSSKRIENLQRKLKEGKEEDEKDKMIRRLKQQLKITATKMREYSAEAHKLEREKAETERQLQEMERKEDELGDRLQTVTAENSRLIRELKPAEENRRLLIENYNLYQQLRRTEEKEEHTEEEYRKLADQYSELCSQLQTTEDERDHYAAELNRKHELHNYAYLDSDTGVLKVYNRNTGEWVKLKELFNELEHNKRLLKQKTQDEDKQRSQIQRILRIIEDDC